MRKNFITREYSSEPRSGTLSMKEFRNFFSSKILEIEDIMNIDSSDIIWSENTQRTQGIGIDNINRILDTYSLKKDNHKLRIFPLQSEQQKKEFTRWEFTINIRETISEWLFAQLKRSETFSGIENRNTINNSVDDAIKQYITDNIYPRINFKTIDLYIRYYEIGETQQNNELALQFDPKFQENIIIPDTISGETQRDFSIRSEEFKNSLLIKDFELTTDASENIATLIFKQTESSLNFKYDYYFDIIWEKS